MGKQPFRKVRYTAWYCHNLVKLECVTQISRPRMGSCLSWLIVLKRSSGCLVMLGSMETVLLMLLIVPLGPRRQLSFSMVRFPLDFYFRLLGGLQLFFNFIFFSFFFTLQLTFWLIQPLNGYLIEKSGRKYLIVVNLCINYNQYNRWQSRVFIIL